MSITIEKWKAIPPLPAPAHQPGRLPLLPPETNQQADPQAYTVTSGDLRLEFMDLFLRNLGPSERDIVINETRPQYIAMRGLQLTG